MTNLVEDILSKKLTPHSLENYIGDDPFIIDKPCRPRNLTPLAIAVIASNLEAVELLLYYQADANAVSPTDARTPLQFATSRKLGANQTAIISALLRADADVNRVDTKRGDDTPLINAIQLRDKTIVQLLVDHGADVKHTNARGKSAEAIAKIYRMEQCLRPRTKKTVVMGHFIDLIVAFVMFILALLDNAVIEGAVKGAISKLYQITGAKNLSATDQAVFEDLGQRVDSQSNPTDLDITSDHNWVTRMASQSSIASTGSIISTPDEDTPAPITEAKLERVIDDFLEHNDLRKFFTPEDNFVKDLAKNATALSQDVSTIYVNPGNVERITKLSLYQPVIYCDDSGSMTTEGRYQYLTELVSRIARISTKILPDTDDKRVELRFINDGCADRLTPDEIDERMRRVGLNNATRIGTNLRFKILDPLVYKHLGRGRRLRRPLLICTITDGCPNAEPEDTFKQAIMECRDRLVENGYESTAVKFLVSHVGSDKQAEDFLDVLRGEELIRDMVYCTSNRLDEKFRELKAAEDRLEEWLLKTLTSPIMGWD